MAATNCDELLRLGLDMLQSTDSPILREKQAQASSVTQHNRITYVLRHDGSNADAARWSNDLRRMRNGS